MEELKETLESNKEKIEEAIDTVGEVLQEEGIAPTENKFDADGNGKVTAKEAISFAKGKIAQHDILILFTLIYSFTTILIVGKFVCFILFGIIFNIDLSKFANVLNVAIVFIGSAEGIRSIGNSLSSPVGEYQAVPAHKLTYLLGYLIAFIAMTILVVVLEVYVKFNYKGVELVPDFCVNDYANAVLSNVLAYLCARYGGKTVCGIDLSSLPFFKKKTA